MKTKITMSGLSLAAALVLASGCSDDAKPAGDGGTPAGDGGVKDVAASTTDSGGGSVVDSGIDVPGTFPDVPPASSNLDGGTMIAMSSGPWVVYDPTGTGAPAANIMGTATAYDVGGGSTRYFLSVSGLAPMTTYGSHVHKLACADAMAGGHYQNIPSGDAAATDPMFGNAANEVWLDFTTDAMGKATKEVFSTFRPRAGEAKSIVVHAMMTGAGGVAGTKLACLGIAF